MTSDNQGVERLLDDAGIDFIQSGQEARINCPFCQESRKRCYVNGTKGVFHSFNCDKSGRLVTVLKELGINVGKKRNDLQSLRKWAKMKQRIKPKK